ncbi:MAG: hypothetical protein GKR89_31255 [Candidatus Latescibacteria bacterium]|nr:hypothetical protein [Candidatus Latescibacterota bacterium]
MPQHQPSQAEIEDWLRLQEEPLAPFDPGFLSSHNEREWVLPTLSYFHRKRLITDIVGSLKPGKEATVYCCRAHPATDLDLVAAKIYRPRVFRTLKNDGHYRQHRHQNRDRRRQRAIQGNTNKGRAFQVQDWIGYEFQTHTLAHQAGLDVPIPLAQKDHAVLMEFIGTPQQAAPQLHQVDIAANEADKLFKRLLRNVELLLSCHRVHGDLSAYNILYFQGKIWVIDLAQAVDARHGAQALALLRRDIQRLCDFFQPRGIDADAWALSRDLWQRYQRGRLRHHRS